MENQPTLEKTFALPPRAMCIASIAGSSSSMLMFAGMSAIRRQAQRHGQPEDAEQPQQHRQRRRRIRAAAPAGKLAA